MCARTHAHTHTPQISQLETGADLIRKDGVKEKLLDQLEDDANAEDIRSAVLRVLCEDAFKEELRDGHLLLMRDGCVLRHLQAMLESGTPDTVVPILSACTGIFRHVRSFMDEVQPIADGMCRAALSTSVNMSNVGLRALTLSLEFKPDFLEKWCSSPQTEHIARATSELIRSRPFPESRTASYLLLAELAALHPVVAAYWSGHEERRRFLLDHTTESDQDARIAKHKFLSAAAAPEANESIFRNALGDEQFALLQRAIKGGPYFAPAPTSEAQVDMLGAS
eukprot:GHVU01077386.1.p1 GENE.GHVU01077386.1~~GHVU01077386.1.p1  ORF type:complete len:281 (-),score=50.63 GHVU01077386.1:79-921(-)